MSFISGHVPRGRAFLVAPLGRPPTQLGSPSGPESGRRPCHVPGSSELVTWTVGPALAVNLGSEAWALFACSPCLLSSSAFPLPEPLSWLCPALPAPWAPPPSALPGVLSTWPDQTLRGAAVPVPGPLLKALLQGAWVRLTLSAVDVGAPWILSMPPGLLGHPGPGLGAAGWARRAHVLEAGSAMSSSVQNIQDMQPVVRGHAWRSRGCPPLPQVWSSWCPVSVCVHRCGACLWTAGLGVLG